METNLRKVMGGWRAARFGLVALALAAALVLGLGLHRSASAQQGQLPSPADLSRTFINVAKQVKPAVVNIDVVEKSKRASVRLPEGLQIPGFPGFEGQPRRQRGTGSGVIISADGYILTNNHVAAEADQITVTLADGREFKAKRVGTDPETDLAVIKIEASNLPVAHLADSDRIEQGEWVIALGSPFGLSQTMTAGIVSATGRDLASAGRFGVSAGQFTNYIQTDASINPGNSGGPLVNMQGEVVGINTLIFSDSGTNSGVGFAIPSSLASKVYGQLVKSGKVTRGYLGVFLRPITPTLAKAVGYDGTEGALVDRPGEDGPAARAGLKSGDVIVEFDGKPVKSPKQLTEYVADSPVGKVAQLKYVRDGRLQSASVNLGERPAQGTPAEPAGRGEGEEDSGKLGISTSNITPEVARQLKLKITTGVLIQSVQPDSPAAEANLQRGDVIHRINRMPITNRQDFMRAVASLRGEKEIAMQIERDGQLTFVSLTLE
jgi:serine protease Do